MGGLVHARQAYKCGRYWVLRLLRLKLYGERASFDNVRQAFVGLGSHFRGYEKIWNGERFARKTK